MCTILTHAVEVRFRTYQIHQGTNNNACVPRMVQRHIDWVGLPEKSIEAQDRAQARVGTRL